MTIARGISEYYYYVGIYLIIAALTETKRLTQTW